MNKRYMQLLFVVAVVCAILWAVLSGTKPADDQPATGTNGEHPSERTDVAGLPADVEPEASVARESPRHAAGALEKSRRENLAALNKAVLEQEEKVKEGRKVLGTIVRTKGIIYREGENIDSKTAADAAHAAQEYVEAKREFEAEQELLQEMKLKLLGETISAKIAEAESKKKAPGK